MNFAARLVPASGKGRDATSPPNSVPANPYEFFVAETQRRFQILIQAGVDEDKAIECASFAAMDRAWKLNADDYEFCNEVYGAPPR